MRQWSCRSGAGVPRPGPARPVLMLRMAQEDIARLDELAERDEVTRSEVARRLLEFGMERMPAGWRPEPAET